MPGNSKRQGATRKRQGGNPTAGSGGRRRRGLEGKGPTPKARDREGHKAHKSPKSADKRGGSGPGRRTGGRKSASVEWVAGRNSVVEALQAAIPVTTMYVAEHTDRDDRVREAFKLAAEQRL